MILDLILLSSLCREGSMVIEVLYEDNHCLAINKPAGLLTQRDETGDPSVVDLVATYLKDRYQKPGNVYVGLVHRLDRPTSGVLLLARTSKAAGRLAAQFRAGTVEKTYLAIVEGRVAEEAGEWSDRLSKDRDRNVVALLPDQAEAGLEASLTFRVLERQGDRTMLELRPRTGRSHQLRVQLAGRGYPIVGDRKYGARSVLGAEDGGFRIALHAQSLKFIHPTRREEIAVTAPLTADWPGPRS
jgi:23S rRNA pseudouridine1911/1915/1917 synthase